MATEHRIVKFSGAVEVGVRNLSTGSPDHAYITNLRAISCANTELTLETETEFREVKESCTKANATIGRVPLDSTATISLTMEQASAAEFAIAMSANRDAVAGAVIVEESLGTPTNGDIIYLKNSSAITALSIVDSDDPTPTALVLDEHYEVIDAKVGKLRMLDVEGLEGPLLASYTHAGYTNMQLLSNLEEEVALVFDGVNQDDGMRVLLRIPRWSVTVDGGINFLGDDILTVTLSGPALFSGETQLDPILGPFGRAVYLED
jgi:hypothetical protein